MAFLFHRYLAGTALRALRGHQIPNCPRMSGLVPARVNRIMERAANVSSQKQTGLVHPIRWLGGSGPSVANELRGP